jgi:hypothetical protein
MATRFDLSDDLFAATAIRAAYADAEPNARNFLPGPLTTERVALPAAILQLIYWFCFTISATLLLLGSTTMTSHRLQKLVGP